MSVSTLNLHEIIDSLTEEDKEIIYTFAKRLVLLYDPDFTKVTLSESKQIKKGEKQIENGECFTFEQIMAQRNMDVDILK